MPRDRRARVHRFDRPKEAPKNKLVAIIHPCTTTLRFVVFSLSFLLPPLFLTCLWCSSISRWEFHSPLSGLWVCYQATAESKGLTKADSVQATWVGSLAMWNRERVVTANYWTTPALEIKAIASHGRTGLGLKAVGAWKERLRGWRMGGWKKGDGPDLKLQRQDAQEGSMSDFLGGVRSLRLANPRGQTTPVSQEEGTLWCLDGILLFFWWKLKECPLTLPLYCNANAQVSTQVWFHKYGLRVQGEFC